MAFSGGPLGRPVLMRRLAKNRDHDLWPRHRGGLDNCFISRLLRRAKWDGRCRHGCGFPEGWKIVAAHVSAIDVPQGQKAMSFGRWFDWHSRTFRPEGGRHRFVALIARHVLRKKTTRAEETSALQLGGRNCPRACCRQERALTRPEIARRFQCIAETPVREAPPSNLASSGLIDAKAHRGAVGGAGLRSNG